MTSATGLTVKVVGVRSRQRRLAKLKRRLAEFDLLSERDPAGFRGVPRIERDYVKSDLEALIATAGTARHLARVPNPVCELVLHRAREHRPRACAYAWAPQGDLPSIAD